MPFNNPVGFKAEPNVPSGPWQAPLFQQHGVAEDMGSDSGDGWLSSDDDGFDLEPELTLDSIAKRKTINFPIRASYTTWDAWEAFRELVQNWRDAIIRSFRLRENEFHVLREEKSGPRNTIEIIYRVLHPTAEPKKWLGYIRFKGRADGLGCVDIVNRKATLQPCHLDMGGTSKGDAKDQAGAFGEGLKIALLVLMRNPQNHSVQCRSGGFTWKFDFTNQGRLVARLSRMTPQAITNARNRAEREVQAKKTLLPFAAEPDQDVQFLIGQNCMGRDRGGRRVRRDLVSVETFKSWLKAALFLQETKDGGVILTKSGDLIREEHLRGNLYLKGLLLGESRDGSTASVTGKKLSFGYNFSSGKTNRERETLATASDESQAIFAIWNRALALRPPIIEELSDMLNSTETDYADVSMAVRSVKIETVCRLKEYLFGESFVGKWYYTEKEKSENPRLNSIIQGLGCEGMQLKDSFWAILRKHNFIRTAEEEQQRRFLRAEAVSVPGTNFATLVHRLLRACIHACQQTDEISVQFVDAGPLLLQSYHDETENVFKIHSRWLTSDGASEELGLEGDLMIEDDIIFHAVKSLFGSILELVSDDEFVGDGPGDRASTWYRKREVNQAEQRLLGYLRVQRDLEFNGSYWKTYRPDISVSWTNSFAPARWATNTQVEIQLHLVRSCSHMRDTLISSDVSWDKLPCKPQDGRDLERNSAEADGSRSKCVIVRVPFSRATFTIDSGLKGGDEYFVIFSIASEPRSIAVISKDTWVVPRRAPPPEPIKKTPENLENSPGNSKSDPKAQCDTGNLESSEPKSPIRSSTPLPARENTPASPTPPPAEAPTAVNDASKSDDCLKHGTSYKLGAARPDSESLTTRKSRLFDAIHDKSNEVKGVIAIFTDSRVDAPASDSRKRPRVVYEIDP